jgi:hypothetical protein
MRSPTRLIRLIVGLLPCVVLLPLLLVPAPALAAPKGGDGRTTTPATPANMDLYMRISAINFCLARSIGALEFSKAVPIAGETVVVILQNEHGSVIQQVGDKPLSLEELRRGAYDSVLIGALTFCPKEMPDDIRQKVEATIKNAQAPGSQAGPGAASTQGRAGGTATPIPSTTPAGAAPASAAPTGASPAVATPAHGSPAPRR